MGEKIRNALDLIPSQLRIDLWEYDGSFYSCVCRHCEGKVTVDSNGVVTNGECLNSIRSCLRTGVEATLRKI